MRTELDSDEAKQIKARHSLRLAKLTNFKNLAQNKRRALSKETMKPGPRNALAFNSSVNQKLIQHRTLRAMEDKNFTGAKKLTKGTRFKNKTQTPKNNSRETGTGKSTQNRKQEKVTKSSSSKSKTAKPRKKKVETNQTRSYRHR